MDQTTFEKIVLEVLEWFKEYEITLPEEVDKFKNTSVEGLISYHTTLGMDIRNAFKLWTITWEPELIDGVDYSPNHPDEISMRIITEVWKRIQDN